MLFDYNLQSNLSSLGEKDQIQFNNFYFVISHVRDSGNFLIILERITYKHL